MEFLANSTRLNPFEDEDVTTPAADNLECGGAGKAGVGNSGGANSLAIVNLLGNICC